MLIRDKNIFEFCGYEIDDFAMSLLQLLAFSSYIWVACYHLETRFIPWWSQATVVNSMMFRILYSESVEEFNVCFFLNQKITLINNFNRIPKIKKFIVVNVSIYFIQHLQRYYLICDFGLLGQNLKECVSCFAGSYRD